MKRIMYTILVLFVCSGWSAYGQDPDDWNLGLFDSALAQVGMNRDSVRFDFDEMATWGGDLWRTSYFTMLHRNPFKLPKYGELTLEELTRNVTNITALLSGAARRIDHPIRRGLIGDQLAAYVNYPDSTPKPSITDETNLLKGEEFAIVREKIDVLYRLVDDDNSYFMRGMEEINSDSNRQKLFDYFVHENEDYDDLVVELAGKTDFDRLYAGAEDFAEAIRRLADSVEYGGFPEKVTEMETPHGLIVVGTTGNDTYEYAKPPLLIVDGGGDDVYSFDGYPAASPLSAIVDVAGNDRYVSGDTTMPGIGGAVIGMSVVIDKSGNDRYEAANVGEGSGVFGVGIVLDYTGDDVYIGRSLCQGAGSFGIGILADSAGADSMYCIISSQAYAYTRGCGTLVNFEGNDIYVAEDDTLINPSSQTGEHNLSLAQGSAFGKRADFVDGHSWAGGAAVLCDVSGDDEYCAGLFAQGCAYWFSVGMLIDGGGNDRYNGVWYVQGAGAHFGVGYLDDFGGDDAYHATNNMAVGAGHDFTIGYFNERGGNDEYTVPNLSLGGGNADGIGIFHDYSGDDVYRTKGGVTLGRASTAANQGPRVYLHTFGVFVDGGGEDSYDVDYAANGSRWVGPKSDAENPNPYEIGVGIDR